MESDIAETHYSCKVKDVIKVHPSKLSGFGDLGTCSPIYTIGELIKWKPDDQLCQWRNFVIPKAPTTDHKVAGFGFNCHDKELQLTRLVGNSTPKTILCHDYKGGYLDDRFPNGVETDDIYSFFHWSAIDIFIYFSHKIVSIPTLSWLNAAHRHGCKVLGTFITEFADGEAAWSEILRNDENFSAVINNLVEICSFFRFDGYLLNVENAIPPEHIPRLIDFVRLLTEKLHQVSSDYEVIWYDSVIAPTGKLKWQNKLCPLNRVFFDLCDGIFLNYCWNEDDLAESVSRAGIRKHDVFVGVDVFGRGCHGGGGFNSSQAMKLVQKYDLSTAIFAPGWTFEKCPAKVDFLTREIWFWNFIWPYLFVHGPVSLPFTTTFCIGRGKSKWLRGRRIGSEWGCLSEQEYQLSTCFSVGIEVQHSEKPFSETGCLKIVTTESFTGGTCLTISKKDEGTALNDNMIRLLTCGFSCSGPISIDFTYKSTSQNAAALALVLFVEYKSHLREVFLATDAFIKDMCDRASISATADCEIRDVQSNPHIDIVEANFATYQENGWITHTFLYNLNGRTIIEINSVNVGDSPVLLGQLSIQNSGH